MRGALKITEYLKRAQGIIDRGIKSGHEANMLKHLGTLDVNKLVKSKKGLEKLKSDMKYIRQIPTIEKDNKNYERKVERQKLIKELKALQKEQIKEVKDEYGTRVFQTLKYDRTYKNLAVFENFGSFNKNTDDNGDIANAIHEMKTVKATTHARNLMGERVEDFFDDYFKELKYNYDDIEYIDELKDHFKDNLADYHDFVSYICNPSFKGDYDSNAGKVNGDDYQTEMEKRLHAAHDLMKTRAYK